MEQKDLRKIKKLQNILKLKSPRYRKDALIVFGRKPENYQFLKELTDNLINGVIKIEPQHKKRLRKMYKYMKALLNKKPKTKKEKDKLILQTGGYLQIVIPILSSLLAKVIDGSLA